MATIEHYLEASERENTRRSYDSALRHFEVEWGGHLPATPDSVARYLAENANDYAINTLKQRLAALAHWHHEHGFVDPTRTSHVRKVLKGIQTLHRGLEKQAKPLQLNVLAQIADWLDGALTAARIRKPPAQSSALVLSTGTVTANLRSAAAKQEASSSPHGLNRFPHRSSSGSFHVPSSPHRSVVLGSSCIGMRAAAGRLAAGTRVLA